MTSKAMFLSIRCLYILEYPEKEISNLTIQSHKKDTNNSGRKQENITNMKS